ncbi:hypothetical protein EYF80_044579 [Liparis tanakae]|uniref:Uncharacterized protein n=1 Tax=Liparis tanakae TaxID=230148 RepID=A0A4Z2FVJ3_9TELE|nr:hypothetical protein EYF80_044579 [Liparis tanakae]
MIWWIKIRFGLKIIEEDDSNPQHADGREAELFGGPGIRFNKGISELGMGAGWEEGGREEGGGGGKTNGTEEERDAFKSYDIKSIGVCIEAEVDKHRTFTQETNVKHCSVGVLYHSG